MANAVSVPNPVKELLKADKVALGMLVRLARSGGISPGLQKRPATKEGNSP